jgi:hypothetical protein
MASKELSVDPLNVVEQGELRKAEAIIEKGQQMFMDVGNALATIRDGKLYRETYKTFDAYCKERWKFDRTYAHRLITAAVTVENVAHGQQITTERQARELAKVPKEKLGAVLERAIDKADGKKLTAATIKEAASELVETDPKSEEPLAEPEPIAEIMAAVNSGKLKASARQLELLAKFDEDTQEAMLEALLAGRQTITEAIEAGCAAEPGPEEIMKKKAGQIESLCRGIMKFVEEGLAELDDPWLDDLNRRAGAIQKFKDGCETLRSCKCVALCPKCDGDGCATCHRTGRVTRYTLQQIT